MPRHFVAMAGNHGCLPQYCCAFETLEDAVESVADVHELGRNRRRELLRDHYIELNCKRDGNEYAEIIECNCSDADAHQDA